MVRVGTQHAACDTVRMCVSVVALARVYVLVGVLVCMACDTVG